MSIHNRTHPYLAHIKERALLTGPSSTKETYHIVLDVSAEELPFQVGDSLAVLPENDPEIVSRILVRAGFSGQEKIIDPKTKQELSLRAFLQTKANLIKSSSRFLSFLCKYGAGYSSLLENPEELRLFLDANDVQDALHFSPQEPYPAQPFIEHLLPLMPRFYSIASSPKMFSNEIHLTVASLSYPRHGELRSGVASSFLCKQAHLEKTPVAIYVQPSNHFCLPDPDASIILIGPGTGVAPFRAFLQERLAQDARGRNWLFFGERNKATDFYYEPFFTELAEKRFLRLDTAFSRDQEEKIYVQHRLQEHAASLWDWLQQGAYLYVCGDAQHMAKSVDEALRQIAMQQGGLPQDEAHTYLKALRAEKRYLLDVY